MMFGLPNPKGFGGFSESWKSHLVLQLLWEEKPFSILTLLNLDRILL